MLGNYSQWKTNGVWCSNQIYIFPTLFFFSVSDAYKVSFDAEWAVLVTWFEILGYGSLDYAVCRSILTLRVKNFFYNVLAI